MVDLVSHAWRLYRACAPVLVPAFFLTFIVLRELLVLVLLVDMSPIALLLVATLVQAVIPAFLGSLLVAPAVAVLAGESQSKFTEAWASLAPERSSIYRAAACSAGLALFAAITLGPVGIIVQPMLLGPPLLIHEIALKRQPFTVAWERTKEMVASDARPLALLLIVPAAVGLLLSIALRTFGVLSGDVPGVARGVVYFAVQGGLIGAALPYTAAVGLLCYRDLASTSGGDAR